MTKRLNIPYMERYVADVLHAHGGEAYVVGGFVRDALRGVEPHDCDIATNIPPDIGMSLFVGSNFYAVDTGVKYGTFTVLSLHNPEWGGVEVTTYRTDGRYTDGRRPDGVVYAESIEEDLSRRDFTMNAIAYNPVSYEWRDPYHGMRDIDDGVIRCVGDANERFAEDALRMLRAARFRAALCYVLDTDVWKAMVSQRHRLATVSRERVGAEMLKLVMGADAAGGLDALMQTGLMEYIIPELPLLYLYNQRNPHHSFDLWSHTLLAVHHTPRDASLRMAALLHDVGKPACQTFGDDGVAHYYGHDEVGAEMAGRICRYLCIPNTVESGHLRDRIVGLVRHHMSMVHMDWSDKAMRRFVARHGREMALDIVDLQSADLLATGTRQRVEHDEEMQGVRDRVIAIADTSPCATAQLAINGHDVMALTGWETGPNVGRVLRALHECVLDDPARNTREELTREVEQMACALS